MCLLAIWVCLLFCAVTAHSAAACHTALIAGSGAYLANMSDIIPGSAAVTMCDRIWRIM